jgi:lipopolysaccharide cholinephosphotransferase
MKKIETVQELRDVQLDILLKIHEFCVENNINYSLSCGTLLGAIRHKGYIPWDDDIDIQLLRDDYNKLMKEFPQVYKDVSLYSLERTPGWPRAYAQAFDTRTISVEHLSGQMPGVGIAIDVFPTDKVPDNEEEWHSYNRKRMFWQNVYFIKAMRWSSKRSLKNNLFMLLAKLPIVLMSLRSIAKCIDKMSQKYNSSDSRFVFENCQGTTKGSDRYLLADFSEYADCSFEGHQLKIAKGYDDILKCLYGDYMQLPPVEDRESTHTFEAYWK